MCSSESKHYQKRNSHSYGCLSLAEVKKYFVAVNKSLFWTSEIKEDEAAGGQKQVDKRR